MLKVAHRNLTLTPALDAALGGAMPNVAHSSKAVKD